MKLLIYIMLQSNKDIIHLVMIFSRFIKNPSP